MNKLKDETSPYLLQHASNPIDWFPWCDDAFELAKKEDKLIILSVGYSSCHWCHVMAHETFENEEVAAFTNAHFISIKVDREERPDLDQLYMTSVQMMTGQGGWPLNCILLPDKSPIYGGTYFPKDHWMKVISTLMQTKLSSPKKLLDYGLLVKDGLIEINEAPANNGQSLIADDIHASVVNWKRTWDLRWGGRQGAPKFPLPTNWLFLLSYCNAFPDQEAKDFLTKTLHNICLGGIHDPVEGGLFRYSVDEFWKIPHFEKMLYDNAQMIELLSYAYISDPSITLKHQCEKNIQWMLNTLQTNQSALFSATDADTDGIEGAYYVWEQADFETLTDAEKKSFGQTFYTQDTALWEEGRFVFYRKDEWVPSILDGLHNSLISWRTNKTKPFVDYKCISSWNALAVSGLCAAYFAFDKKEYVENAKQISQWLLDVQIKEAGVFHIYAKEESKITGLLEDVACIIRAFIDLYVATTEIPWLYKAKDLLNDTISLFFRPEKGFFDDSINDLMVGILDVQDNVIPANNSLMCENLIRLGHYFRNEEWLKMAHRMCLAMVPLMVNNLAGYSQWGINAMLLEQGPIEISLLNIDEKTLGQFRRYFQKNWVLSYHNDLPVSKEINKTVSICGYKQCYIATNEVDEALVFLQSPEWKKGT